LGTLNKNPKSQAPNTKQIQKSNMQMRKTFYPLGFWSFLPAGRQGKLFGIWDLAFGISFATHSVSGESVSSL
jgi:hypothetical protein